MLSRKTKHLVNILVTLASAPPDRPVTVGTLASRLQVSVSHMETLAGALRDAGFIRSERGPGGGYLMDCDPHQLSIWTVVRAIDPKFAEPLLPTIRGGSIASLEQSIMDAFTEYLSSHTVGEYADPDAWRLASPAATGSGTGTGFRLQPMRQRMRPMAPNSAFQLAAFQGASLG